MAGFALDRLVAVVTINGERAFEQSSKLIELHSGQRVAKFSSQRVEMEFWGSITRARPAVPEVT
jgi:hypothetical protein